MPTIQIVLFSLLAVCLTISLVTDLRSRLIYDAVTFPTIALGLLVRLGHGLYVNHEFPGSPLDPFSFSSGLIATLLGFLPFFMISYNTDGNGIGMGDAKLMAAVGAVLGWQELLPAAWYIALFGGLHAIVLLVIKGQLTRMLGRTFKLLAHLLRIRQLTDEEEAEQSLTLPYGVAIVLGTMWSMVLEVIHAHSASTAG